MTSAFLKGENCKWCGRDLSKSFLARVTLGVEKQDSLLFPVLCLCGGITVIGAVTSISHIDELADEDERGTDTDRKKAIGSTKDKRDNES
jgi:hypothetical protein